MIETTLASLVPRFDAFLVDQFGVLLDGVRAYPFAPAALGKLSEQGKPVVLLSNSGRRAAPNEARLTSLGFDRGTYTALLSSGETAHLELCDRIGEAIAPGARVMVISRHVDGAEVEGLDLMLTMDPAEADLVLISGSRGEELPLDHYHALLADPATRAVPCLCTNPDMTMLHESGTAFGAGRIAQLYEELGGQVEYFGKPGPQIYHAAARLLPDVPPERVLCIGDSPAHDIRGGRAAGHATALVRTGIHADEPLEALLAACPPGDQPDFVIPRFDL